MAKLTPKTLALDTLYILTPTGSDDPAIEIVGGTVDIYGTNDLPTSSPVTTDMYKSGDAFVGIDKLATVPKYLYISQNTGTTTKILLMGVSAVVSA